MTTTRVGVVGGGWVAVARHMPGYRSSPDAELVVLYDRNPDRAREVAQRERIPQWCSTIDELYEAGVDAISICTPPWTHAEIAIDALEHGVHVFTEKPMAMNHRDAAAMAAAARRADRVLCVSHNFLWSRAVQRADTLIRRTGSPTYGMGLQMSSLKRRLPTWYAELPGGLLFDELPHMLYTLDHFLGGLRFAGMRASRGAGGEVRTAEIQFDGEGGPGQVMTVFDSPVSEWHVGLVTPGAAIDLDLFRDICMVVNPDDEHKALDILRTSGRAMFEHARGVVTSGTRLVGRRLYWGHDAVIREFIQATRSGGPSPVDPDVAVGIVRLTDEILAELGAG